VFNPYATTPKHRGTYQYYTDWKLPTSQDLSLLPADGQTPCLTSAALSAINKKITQFVLNQYSWFAFSALRPLVWYQEEQLACRKLSDEVPQWLCLDWSANICIIISGCRSIWVVFHYLLLIKVTTCFSKDMQIHNSDENKNVKCVPAAARNSVAKTHWKPLSFCQMQTEIFWPANISTILKVIMQIKVRVQLPTYIDKVALPTTTAVAIDRYLLPAWPTAANLQQTNGPDGHVE